MPSINDIIQVAEALEKSPVAVLQDRCVAVRNRNATCRKCVNICPFDVIEISGNEISFDTGSCVACGACTTVCPTEALVSLRSPDSDLASRAAEATAANDGAAVLACARIAARRSADPDRYAEVPCLARIDESIVVALAAHGAHEVLLVDGDCRTCRYGACTAIVDETLRAANDLIAAHGGEVRATRASGFPEGMRIDASSGAFGSTRRGFFSDAASVAKETALTAAKTTIAQELGYRDEQRSIGDRLRVDDTGAMPRLSMPRHDVLINSMDAIGAPVADTIDSCRFAVVDIDAAKCNTCGMCAVFCPTGALSRDDADAASSPLSRLEFSASSCVQCGLCADVCWKGALSLSSAVPTAQLFDFEPVAFDLSKSAPSKSRLFGR